MNFYKCYIAVDGWSTVYSENIDYLWAVDEAQARLQYCKQNNFRKNKKGLTIEQVEYKKAKRMKSIHTNEFVTESVYNYWLGRYEESVYKEVTHCYCSNCGTEVRRDRYCTCCNSELID